MRARELTADIGELCAMLVEELKEHEELTPDISARCREIADAIRFQAFNSNPTPKTGVPREGSNPSPEEEWRIDYRLNDEPRTFSGFGNLNRLIVVLEDYAFWIGKKLELTSAMRIK